jgi:hypothetical protein
MCIDQFADYQYQLKMAGGIEAACPMVSNAGRSGQPPLLCTRTM